MTEEEWLSLDRVLTPTMNWLRRRGTTRQFYLAAAGWVCQVESKQTHPRCRELIELVEGYADGGIPAELLDRRSRAARAILDLGRVPGAYSWEASAADSAAVHSAYSGDGWIAAINALNEAGRSGKRSELSPRQIALLRDVFSNPFRPISFDASWRTSTAVAIAKQMYESREFGAMPILADALQDAGCGNDDILSHCRDANGVHIRGCWVVDLVLDKK